MKYCSFIGELKRKKKRNHTNIVDIVFALQAASREQHKYLILPQSISVSCLQCLCSHACGKISPNKGVLCICFVSIQEGCLKGNCRYMDKNIKPLNDTSTRVIIIGDRVTSVLECNFTIFYLIVKVVILYDN